MYMCQTRKRLRWKMPITTSKLPCPLTMFAEKWFSWSQNWCQMCKNQTSRQNQTKQVFLTACEGWRQQWNNCQPRETNGLQHYLSNFRTYRMKILSGTELLRLKQTSDYDLVCRSRNFSTLIFLFLLALSYKTVYGSCARINPFPAPIPQSLGAAAIHWIRGKHLG